MKTCETRGPGGVRICERDAIEGGPRCDQHGCVQCGHVIAADHEDERLCFNCAERRAA